MSEMSQKQFKRLRDAVASNRKDLAPHIEKQLESSKQLAGCHYGKNDTKALPLNIYRMFVTVMNRMMTARDPKVTVTTEYRELNACADRLERALSYQAKRVGFKTVMRRVNQDGLTGVGLMKVGMKATRLVEWDGEVMYMPEPFVARVALEDAILDMSAKSWEAQQFLGHRFMATGEEIRKRFGATEEEVQKWEEENGFFHDEDGNEREATISQQQRGMNARFFEPLIEMNEVYVKSTGMVVTYPVVEDGRMLDERRYYGPEEGPIERMNVMEIGGQVLPVAPGMMIRDLHDAINYVYRKCIDQAHRQKTLWGVRGSAQKDIERQMKARDGYAVKLDSPQGVVKMDFPGVNREALAFVIDAMARANFFGGNLEVLAGLGAGADTLGQEQIMSAGANKLAEELSDASYTLGRWGLRSVGLYLWEDEATELPLSHRIPGTNIDLKSVWNSEQRRGEFIDHNIDIEYGSMAPQNNAAKFNTMLTFLERIVMPLMADLQQNGVTLDVEHVAKLAAKMLDLKELDEILIFSNSQDVPKTPVGESARMSPVSTRRYVRENKSTRTQRGTDNALTSMLMGNGQPSEAASLTGSTV